MRSEDLSLDVREESAALDGTVYAVEPLGDRTLVDVEIGDAADRHQGGADDGRSRSARQIRAAVDLDRVHLFDAATESAIARG